MARFGGGWIKIHRSILENVVSQRDIFTFGVFNRLLAMANWKESSVIFGGKKITLIPGQLVTGLRELSPDLDEDPYLNKIRNALSYLVLCEAIEQATNNQGRLITIRNWAKYQDDDSAEFTCPTSEEQTAHKRRTSDAQLSEEDKKERKNTRRSRAEYGPAFEEIYNLYPKKEGKQAGHKVYLKLSGEEIPQLQTAIANYCRAKSGTEAQYLKMFSTFMGEWKDWLDPKTGTVAAPVVVKTKTINEMVADGSINE
jgi:hypothetical protein